MTDAAVPVPRGFAARLWRRLCRFSFTRRRRTRKKLAAFCARWATEEYTLVVHSTDIEHRKYFPNAFVVSSRAGRRVDLETGATYEDLRLIGDESFAVILCTGLLEHLPDPAAFVAELHRILKPGGRLILSASAVFPFHGAPDNYFHFTPNGLRRLFRDWARFEALQGSTGPFETIAVLLQRINIQCDVFPPLRPLIELAYHVLPWFDVFVIRQYDSTGRRDDPGPVDAAMPATLHAVVAKAEAETPERSPAP